MKNDKWPLPIILSHVSHFPTECSCSSESDTAELPSAVALLFSSTLPTKSRHGCPCRALHFSHYHAHVHQFWSPCAHTSSAPMACCASAACAHRQVPCRLTRHTLEAASCCSKFWSPPEVFLYNSCQLFDDYRIWRNKITLEALKDLTNFDYTWGISTSFNGIQGFTLKNHSLKDIPLILPLVDGHNPVQVCFVLKVVIF